MLLCRCFKWTGLDYRKPEQETLSKLFLQHLAIIYIAVQNDFTHNIKLNLNAFDSLMIMNLNVISIIFKSDNYIANDNN